MPQPIELKRKQKENLAAQQERNLEAQAEEDARQAALGEFAALDPDEKARRTVEKSREAKSAPGPTEDKSATPVKADKASGVTVKKAAPRAAPKKAAKATKAKKKSG